MSSKRKFADPLPAAPILRVPTGGESPAVGKLALEEPFSTPGPAAAKAFDICPNTPVTELLRWAGSGPEVKESWPAALAFTE